MRKADKEPPTELERLRETIFGSDYEVDDELADEILASHNISSSELVEEFKLRMQAELKGEFEETGKINQSLEAALKSIRAQQQGSKPLPIKAESWIDGLLGGAISSTSGSQVLFSFHKQKEGEVSASDRVLLDELERELDQE
jgi:hypothetical protein